MKNFRSSLILALVVAGLFGFLLFGNRHIQGTAQRDQASLFPDLDPDKAEFLKITDPDGVVEVRKKDGLWAVTAPVATEADAPAVSDVLRSLEGLRALRVIPLSDIQKSGETLQSWQLVPGVVRAEFSGPGFSGQLRLGRKTAVSNLLYASASAAPDAPVVLLPATSRDDIDKKLADLRSRAALPFAPAEISQCGLRGAPLAGGAAAPSAPAAEIQLARSGSAKDAVWKLEKPLSTAADAGRVSKWLQALASLKIRQFVSDDASDLTAYGLNIPVSQIWVQGAGAKAPETLLVGLPVPGTPAGSQGQVYAKRLSGDTVFTLAAGDVERLVRGLSETRDRKVVPFAAANAVAVKIETGLDGKASPAHTVAAKKDNGTWAYDNGGAAPFGAPDADRLGDFLQALSTLEAAQIVSDIAGDLKPYGLDRPSARITITLKKGDGTDTETFLLGKAISAPALAPVPTPTPAKAPPASPALLYAKNADQPVVYAVPAAFADALPHDPWQWLDARPVPGGPDASKIVRLDFVPDAGTPFHVTRGAQGDYQTDWTGVTVVPALAAAQAATVAGLRAERWLGPVQPAFGLAKPRWKVTVATEGGPAYVLLLGAELPGAQGEHAAQVEGQPYAFAIAPSDYAALATQPFAPLAGTPAAATPPSVPAPSSPH